MTDATKTSISLTIPIGTWLRLQNMARARRLDPAGLVEAWVNGTFKKAISRESPTDSFPQLYDFFYYNEHLWVRFARLGRSLGMTTSNGNHAKTYVRVLSRCHRKPIILTPPKELVPKIPHMIDADDAKWFGDLYYSGTNRFTQSAQFISTFLDWTTRLYAVTLAHQDFGDLPFEGQQELFFQAFENPTFMAIPIDQLPAYRNPDYQKKP